MKFRYTMPDPVGFQLAPMIDIVFLLLVFFIVNQTISLTELDLKLKIPNAINGEKQPRQLLEIIINVRQNGDAVINGQVFSQEQLRAKLNALTSASAESKNTPIRLRADANTRYEDIVKVIDICRQEGIWNISFNVTQAKQSPANS